MLPAAAAAHPAVPEPRVRPTGREEHPKVHVELRERPVRKVMVVLVPNAILHGVRLDLLVGWLGGWVVGWLGGWLYCGVQGKDWG